jgi:hypothetical protein
MDYLKYQDTMNGLEGYVYIELEDGYAVRQIFKSGDFYIASNRKDNKYDFWLAEGFINVYEYADDIIYDMEFNAIWQEFIEKLQIEWCTIKQTYKIGTIVYANIEVFYPQGVIVNIGNSVLGIADYDECKNSTTPDKLYPDHKIEAIVNGYDEVNMWPILGKSKVIN